MEEQNKQYVIEPTRTFNQKASFLLLTGSVMGSGIFFKQADVLKFAGSPFWALMAWILGGLITLTASLTISELGSKYTTGGIYTYLKQIYGKFAAFMSGWVQVIIYGPATIATLGMYLAIMLVDFMGLPLKYFSYLAIGIVVLTFAANSISLRYGVRVQMELTIIKIILIIAIVVGGLLHGKSQIVVTSSSGQNLFDHRFGVAVISCLFAYDGWSAIANMGREVQNPSEVIPQTLIKGALTVLVSYVLITVVFLQVLPPELILDLGKETAPFFGHYIFGKIGGKIFNIGIILTILACLNGKMITFSRVVLSMANDNQLPFSKHLMQYSTKSQSPILAIALISMIAITMIIFFDPGKLSRICIFSIYLFYLMSFIGVFIIRHRKVETPYEVPLFPVIPLIAIIGAIFVLYSEIVYDWEAILVLGGFGILGIPVYFLMKHHRKKAL
ncbi:APC family permease [Ligilactobacillus sp. LYQ135]